jgi:basic amino acid/polyamine antiporter, APA family
MCPQPIQTELKRSLPLPLITFYGLGTIIGAGIYVLVGKVAGLAGMYAPFAFALAAIIAGFTAFSYAELSARYPRSAGEAVYVEEAFHRRMLSGVTGWAVVLMGIVSSATLANGFVGYLRVFVQAPDWLAIVTLVIGLGLLAGWGISQSVWVATLTTLLELFGLLMVLFLAGDSLAELPQRWQQLIPPLRGDVWLGIMLAAFLAFYAFIGFEDMVNVAEEVKNPQRNLPLAIVIALIATTVIYVLIALVAVLAMAPQELARSDAPLASLIEQRGHQSVSIGLIGLVAVVNGALIQIIMASRVVYGMARERMAPPTFATVNPRTQTPVRATIAVTLAILVPALWLPLVKLAETTSFITLIVFALINLALWRLKLRVPHPAGVVRCPLWVPVTGLTLCVGLLLFRIAF